MGFDNILRDCSSGSPNMGSPPPSALQPSAVDELYRYLSEMALDAPPAPAQRTNSLSSLNSNSKPTIEMAMEEFRTNGFDTPYDPEEDYWWNDNKSGQSSLSGGGGAPSYLRQKSWPAPDASPLAPLPHASVAMDYSGTEPSACSMLTPSQRRALETLPDGVLYALLKELGEKRAVGANRSFEECRFCKNNGERQSYYRSHALRDVRGRVRCPVLRAFVCRRCGAHGDNAHTAKYCPLSTERDRQQSVAMLRSVRLASGRKRLRAPSVSAGANHDDATSMFDIWNQPLDPVWAELEKKLLM